MSEEYLGDAVERLEWDERKQDETPYKRWRQFTRRTALTGGAAGIAALALEACGGSSSNSAAAGGSAASGIFGANQSLKFTFVNHVTTNTFFTPTQNGAADACKLLGCSYQWTGSQTSNISEMVNAFNTGVAGGANGIAVSLIDPSAFNGPTTKALAAGIPVVAYNADAAGNARLAYIGQDLKKAGEEMGKRIVSAVGSGEVGLFIATPGSANLQPRIEGAEKAIKAAGGSITAHSVATGAAVAQEQSAIEAWYLSHKSAKGMYAVDGGSTESLAKVMQKLGLAAKGIKAGGFDLTEQTQKLLSEGNIEFTIDQQPYLQGFLPVFELFMYKVSGTLTGLFEANTGLKFVTKETVGPYLKTKSRYEGTSTAAAVIA
jgi:simple sugar transport system substrate-binding protein